jgi:hypothetical protein
MSMQHLPRTRVIAGALACSLLAVAPVHTAKPFSAWSEPENLGEAVNTPYQEFLPELSKNELSLYFSSNRPGLFGGEDIWVARRSSREDSWGPAVNLGAAINTRFNERAPALSRDGHDLFFATDRPGGLGLLDIWVSWRAHTHDDLAWRAPVNLGAGVNSVAGDFGPSYFENDELGVPTLFFASTRPGGAGGVDIYRSELTLSGAFGPAVPVAELNTPQNDFRPTIRADGLELILDSNRPGSSARDLWRGTRPTVTAVWSTPVNLGSVVNGPFNDSLAALSPDGSTLVLTSDRADGSGFGGSDLYISSRSRK